MNIDDAYVIFASNFPFNKVEKYLHDRAIPYKRLQGKYLGVYEDSYIVNLKHRDLAHSVLLDGQECVLVLSRIMPNGYRRALIHYNNTEKTVQEIGYFIPVPRERALQSASFTYDPINNEYYVAELQIPPNLKSV